MEKKNIDIHTDGLSPTRAGVRGEVNLYALSLSVPYNSIQYVRDHTGLTQIEINLLLGYDLALFRSKASALCLADMEKLSGIHTHSVYYSYVKRLVAKGYLEAISRFTYKFGRVSTRYGLNPLGRQVIAMYEKEFNKQYEHYCSFARSNEVPNFEGKDKPLLNKPTEVWRKYWKQPE